LHQEEDPILELIQLSPPLLHRDDKTLTTIGDVFSPLLRIK